MRKYGQIISLSFPKVFQILDTIPDSVPINYPGVVRNVWVIPPNLKV